MSFIKPSRFPVSLFGCRDSRSTNTIEAFLYETYIRVGYNKSTYQLVPSVIFSEHEIDFNKNRQQIDTVYHDFTYANFAPSYSFCIGTVNTAGEPDDRMYNGNLYNFSIYSNDVLTHYYIPCQRISDETVGLYDTVTNEFVIPVQEALTPGPETTNI